MNPTQLHLALSHFPVIGYILMVPVFWFAVWKRKEAYLNLSLLFFIVLGILSFVVFNTGSMAEENLTQLPGMDTDLISKHEKSGEISFWLFAVSGLLSAILMAFNIKLKEKQHLIILVVCGILFSTAAIHSLYTASIGGEIRHTEIRSIQ